MQWPQEREEPPPKEPQMQGPEMQKPRDPRR